ncbi:GAG-POL precursor [Panicum miliaceum]|uniref:GAG-POL n=1 Tax=Panicum miliaceum TaxID=4540 RepID=A0A3L6PQM4_PANMI|nr:GAG-POL precursor [Panicum miliaceum]
MPQGRFVYLKGFEPSELLDYESRLVAFTQGLPFQEGRPLSPIAEERESSTELLEYNLMANHSPDRQVCMASLRNAEDDELDPQYDNEQLEDVLADEPTADAPQDEDEEHRWIRRVRNAKRAQRRCNTQNRAREPRDLNNAFAAVADREYRTPIDAIAKAALLAPQLPSNPQIQRKHRTPASRRNDNRQRNKGHPSARGNNEQEVKQPTYNQRRARHQGHDPLEANLHEAPTIDLRQKINKGRDARLVIKARTRDRTGRRHDDNDSDCFPAFTTSITDKSYPKDFKQVGIPKYDGKYDPRQWIRCYSVAIEVSWGSSSTKALYFPVALDSAPLAWLESLKPNSIDSWEDLKRALINNFQGSMIRASTRYDLSQVKQEMNETLMSYTRHFFETRATIANITDEDVIRCFQNTGSS